MWKKEKSWTLLRSHHGERIPAAAVVFLLDSELSLACFPFLHHLTEKFHSNPYIFTLQVSSFRTNFASSSLTRV